MANTLSQYIGQIIDRRNQELQQRLAPLIPLLQADLAETKAKAEIEKQKQLRIADYGTMADQSFGEGSSAEWLERAKQYQTPEGADAGWKLFASEKGQAKEGIDYGNLLRSFGVPEDKITEAVGKLGSIESEAGRELIMKEYLQFANTGIEQTRNTAQRVSPEYAADFEKNLAETGDVDKAVGYANKRQAERDEQAQVRNSYRGRGYNPGSGDGGDSDTLPQGRIPDKPATQSERDRVAKVYSPKGYVWVYYAGAVAAVPAVLRKGYLYIEGENALYPIDPSECIQKKDVTGSKYTWTKKDVDRYNANNPNAVPKGNAKRGNPAGEQGGLPKLPTDPGITAGAPGN